MHGTQTALVVGQGPVHTERDNRIKVQFHWQRGGNASHRLGHPAGDDNAPAADASFTWVRVGQGSAGVNHGAVFTPRVGQEVIVAFVGGDIDRPVVLGAAYNGQGQANAQGNQLGGGAAGATGNAPAWFPGDQSAGDDPGHNHNARQLGHKSQALASSASGAGGTNQLVFDDGPESPRIELSSSQHDTRLQLGYLRQQQDNQLLQPRGHGLDLTSQGHGAIRAGSGLLLSAHGQSASTGGGQQLQAREAQSQLQDAQELLHTLAESAQAQQAKGPQEPDVKGAKKEDSARQLPNEKGHYALLDSLATTAQSEGADDKADDADDEVPAIQGGHGTVPAWGRPELLLSAPAGIGLVTPAQFVASAGTNLTMTAGQDLNALAQGIHATVAKAGAVLYTYGKATDTAKPNQETGIALHAASGSVQMSSNTGATRIAADQNLEVTSTSANVLVSAPSHVLLTAAGAAIDIESGGITLKAPGSIQFKASQKNLTAGAAVNPPEVVLPRNQGDPGDQHFILTSHDGVPVANRRYRMQSGNQIITGVTDGAGKTEILKGFVGQGVLFELLPDYCRRFVVRDADGNALANYPYRLTSESGLSVVGTTDAAGLTEPLYSTREESVEISYYPQEFPRGMEVG